MSKRIIFGLSIATMVAAIFSSGAVFAASEENAYRGPNGVAPVTQPGFGYMEDFMVSYVAEQLNVSSDEIQASLDSGLTLAQVLLDYGVSDVWSMSEAARAYAVEQLGIDGIAFPGWQNDSTGSSYMGNGTGMGVGRKGGRFGVSAE
ncbi:MAG: hypothetical protein GYA18_10595 [Chloroflexi bacterium]|nr:hypothetical protein [Chloroflexota bacterium]